VRARAIETLGELGLDGLELKNANDLSGGQKQRVAIARALMNARRSFPPNEPTATSTPSTRSTVYDLFRRISAETNTAFLIVTHDRSVASAGDRILEISDGMLVQDVRKHVRARG